MMRIPVVPAVIPHSREHVLEATRQLAFSPEFQLDLVDGKFVDSVSWPYEPAGEPLSVKPQLDAFTLEVDLMVVDQLSAAKAWETAGADMLVFHVESIALDDLRKFSETTTVSVGVSAHGNTTMETLSQYAEYADYIQLMGIHEIGAQGLPFDEAVLGKIQILKERFPNMSISIDGSVNQNTIKRLRDAGADRFICGSAIVLQDDPEAAWRALGAIINE